MEEINKELEKFCIEYKQKNPSSNIDELYNLSKAYENDDSFSKYVDKLYNKLLQLKNLYIIKNIEYDQNQVLNKNNPELFDEIKNIIIEAKSISAFVGKYNYIKNGGYIEPKNKNKKEEPTINYDLEDIIELRKIQKKLLSLKEKIGSVNTIDSEIVEIRKEVNKLSDKRLEIFIDYFKKQGVILAKKLDSIEYVFAFFNEEYEKQDRASAKEELVRLTEEIYLKISYVSTHGGKNVH